MTRAQARRLPAGRLHLHDGPIDLIIEALGEADEVAGAYAAATRRFATLLDELCADLPLLRAPSVPRAIFSLPPLRGEGRGGALTSLPLPNPPPPGGRGSVVARRMFAAVAPFHAERFITPMAAVAGAVAEEILAAITDAASLAKAYVNNGGDIALHLAPGESFAIGMVGLGVRPDLFGRATTTAETAVRGVATSGWRGRSFSLGIADAVTVLARSAALADAAATLIANAVDLPGHPAIRRAPATARDPQSDLVERLVTIDVGPLSQSESDAALDAGAAEAEHWRRAGWIAAAALRLDQTTRLVGEVADLALAPQPNNEAPGADRDQRSRLHREFQHAIG